MENILFGCPEHQRQVAFLRFWLRQPFQQKNLYGDDCTLVLLPRNAVYTLWEEADTFFNIGTPAIGKQFSHMNYRQYRHIGKHQYWHIGKNVISARPYNYSVQPFNMQASKFDVF